MKDEFEYKVQQKAAQFSLMPSDHIWDAVEDAIDKKKKRRPFIFWWLFSLIGLMSIGFYIFNNVTKSTENNKTECIDENKIKNDSKSNNTTALKNIVPQNMKDNIADINIDYNNKFNGITKGKTEEFKKRIPDQINQKTNNDIPFEKGKINNESEIIMVDSKKVTLIENAIDIQANETKTTLINDAVTANLALIKDSNKLVQNDTIELVKKKKTNSNIDSSLTSKKEQTKKLIPYIFAGGGTCIFEATNHSSPSSMAMSGSTTGGLYNIGNQANSLSGFSTNGYYFSVGAGLEYVLNNNLSVNTQLMYHYIQRNIKATSTNDSIAIYYYPGPGRTYYNSLHQFKLEQGVLFHFSKHKLFRYVQPEIGYSIATNISSNWMAADYWKGAYINDYSSVNNVVFSVYTSLWIPLSNGWVGGITYSKNISRLSEYNATDISAKYFGLSIKKSLSSIFKTSK